MPQYPQLNLQRFVDTLTSHSILSQEEQETILNLPGHAAQVQANRDVVRLDEVVEHACLIVDGVVGRFDQNIDGLRQITALHIPGDMANLHSVVFPKATSALQALSTTTILRVPQAAIRSAARAHPAIAEALWRYCMVDAAILAKWVVNVGRRDAKTRMAHLLCEMAMRYKAGVVAQRVTFDLPLTQAHLADATGLTSVHVNRVLKILREGGLATVRSRTVSILDWEALSELGEFNANYLHTDLKPEDRVRIVEAA
jgi:CRP-like cAMP-binding protein